MLEVQNGFSSLCFAFILGHDDAAPPQMGSFGDEIASPASEAATPMEEEAEAMDAFDHHEDIIALGTYISAAFSGRSSQVACALFSVPQHRKRFPREL